MSPSDVVTRRNLPHWYVPGAMHFVTYRLAGTIPTAVLQQLRDRRAARLRRGPAPGVTPREHNLRAHKHFFAEYDRYLDNTCEINWLAAPAIAALLRGNLHHHNGSKYHLLAYCVMPNHVHALFQPLEGVRGADEVSAGAEIVSDESADGLSPLAKIMHSLKSYTAHKANALLGRTNQFWQHESYDHWVRDDEELERVVHYIAWNPVTAGLVTQPHEWFFSSAHDRFLQDGAREGYLLSAGRASEP